MSFSSTRSESSARADVTIRSRWRSPTQAECKIVGFMPGLSSSGGPSHQAIEDVALMRALPDMTVVQPADALEITQAVADRRPFGPVYMRLKRGEIPLSSRQPPPRSSADSAGSGGGDALTGRGHDDPGHAARGSRAGSERLTVTVVNSPVVKPLDWDDRNEASRSRIVVTAETTLSLAASARRSPKRWPRPAFPRRCVASGCAMSSRNRAAANICSAVTDSAPRTFLTLFGGARDQPAATARAVVRGCAWSLRAGLTGRSKPSERRDAMSLQPFVPTPEFEEYKERFKNHYNLERRPDGVILAQAHTRNGPIQLSVENHRSVGQLFKTIGADPRNEVFIFTGSGPDFMMDADPKGFELEQKDLADLGLRIRLQGRPHQCQFARQRSRDPDHRRHQRPRLPHRDVSDVRSDDLRRRCDPVRSALRHRLGPGRRHS